MRCGATTLAQSNVTVRVDPAGQRAFGRKGGAAQSPSARPVPAGTPPAVVQKLSAALQSALEEPTLVARFNDINTEAVSKEKATPEALRKLLTDEVDRWAPIIKAAGQFAD